MCDRESPCTYQQIDKVYLHESLCITTDMQLCIASVTYVHKYQK